MAERRRRYFMHPIDPSIGSLREYGRNTIAWGAVGWCREVWSSLMSTFPLQQWREDTECRCSRTVTVVVCRTRQTVREGIVAIVVRDRERRVKTRPLLEEFHWQRTARRNGAESRVRDRRGWVRSSG